MKGILGYRDAHFWNFVPNETIGTFHLQIAEDANQQEILSIVSRRFQEHHHISNLTVQIEKEAFLQNIDPSIRMKFHMHSGSNKPLDLNTSPATAHRDIHLNIEESSERTELLPSPQLSALNSDNFQHSSDLLIPDRILSTEQPQTSLRGTSPAILSSQTSVGTNEII